MEDADETGGVEVGGVHEPGGVVLGGVTKCAGKGVGVLPKWDTMLREGETGIISTSWKVAIGNEFHGRGVELTLREGGECWDKMEGVGLDSVTKIGVLY